MALPTSDNTVNVTRLGSILSTLWGKIKTALGNKSNKTEGVYYVAGTTPYTAYSASSTYTKWTSGDYTSSNSCTYGGYAYYCSTAISTAEAWNSAHWTKIPTPTWTGTVTGVTELYTGMKIAYKVPIYGGTSSTYLNINNLGNVYVKRNDGNTTSHLQGNTVVILTYDGTYWRWADYDANSTYSGMVTAYVNNAADAAKAATSTNFKLTDGITILITFNVANTKNAALTLNVNSTGAKTLYINDTVSSASNYTIPAGTYFCHYKVPSGASTGNWYLYTNGTFRAIQFKGDLDGDAATASAAKSGSTLETTINGKQDSLGIDSSAGDTTQFLNKKGQWAVPSGTAQVQSDWNQTTTTAVDYIKNKPQNLVQDASYVHTDNNYTTADKNKVVSAVQPGDLATVATSGSYSDLSGKPSTIGWATYGTTTFAQVTAMLTAGNLPCVNYNNKVYKYLSTPYSGQYVFQAEDLSYVTILANSGESQNVWDGGTAYPSASDIGAAPSVHSHGNIASDGTDGQATHDTTKFLRADGTWAAPGSFAYEHTNEINARNVPSSGNKRNHWFNYRDGDTDEASPDNLITDYYFGNRNNKVDGVKLNADGIISPTRKNAGRMHFCIKITRMNTTENDFATVRVPFSSQDSEENFGYVDIIIKFRTNTWNARAFVFARGAYSKLGQAFYLQDNPNSVGGACYLAIDITDANAYIRFSPIIICHGTSADSTANRAMKIEFGDFTPSGSLSALQTRWPAFIDYNNNSHSAVGSSTQPVYVDANGTVQACSVSDSHYYAGAASWPSATAYAYVKSGITLTVTVDNMIEDKTYTAQVVRASSGSASFDIKFQSNSTFSVYGHTQTTTNVTTFTLTHSLYPMMFMRHGRNIYIISY